MVSLIDILPQTRTVRIAAGDLVLHGLGLRQIADLFLAFPSLRNVFTEGAPDIELAELIVQAPDAIGAIIAAAADQPEAEQAITERGLLTPEEVLDCVTAISELTFPRGIGPFVQRLAALVGGLVAGASGREAATSAPPPPNSLSHKAIASAL